MLRATDFLGLKLEYPEAQYKERPTVYAIVFDEEKNVAAIRYKKFDRHPFPGGGIDKGESFEEALEREVLEEIGCKITDITLVGMFDSWSNKNITHYPTRIYSANISGPKGVPTTIQEYEKDVDIEWLPLAEIVKGLGTDPSSLMIREIIRLKKLA